MDNDNKKKFEMVTTVVSDTLNSLSTLFIDFGMDGLYAITNPSLPELKAVIRDMHKWVVEIEEQIDLGSANDIDSVYALILVPNIKQGLFFAENLLTSVERLDLSECQKAHSDLQKNVINQPRW